MHSVRCFKSICPLIFIDSVVKQLYQGSTIYCYLYTWGNGSSKKSRDLPKVSLLVNHRTRTQTQAGWLQNALCYTWDGAVVPECEMSPKWWRGSWVLCRMNNGNSRNCNRRQKIAACANASWKIHDIAWGRPGSQRESRQLGIKSRA